MASGSSYPGTLDSWVDKLAGDYLTIADVNSRTSAIEKLETGPLRPNDGSAVSPAFTFRSAANSGMFYAAATPAIAFSISGVPVASFIKTGTAVNYVVLIAQPTGAGPEVLATGTDTNVSLVLDTKGAGPVAFAVGGTVKQTIDSSGRLLVGHSVVTGSGAGDIILGSQHSLRSVNAAGTNTAQILGLDASDRLLLGGSGVTDIVWGKALVSLGAGSLPTFGNAGSPGPVVATQNSWMRVVDSGNNPFWVPVWK